jgi:cell wall-associated NlpC family hydrolase
MEFVNIKDLLGIPYKQHGRDKTGFDCYGLVIFLYKRMGRNLPDYLYSKLGNNAFNEIGKSPLELTNGYGVEVDKPNYSDVIMFFDSKNRAVHIAFYLKNDMFIHCDVRGVEVCKLKGFRYSNWRFYRWLPQK